MNLLFRSLLAAGNNDEALETVEQAEKILNSLPDLSQKELILRKARILNTKSNIYYLKGEIETAENWLTWIISLQQDFGVIPEIIYAHIVMAMIMDDVYSEFHLALEHNRNALSLAEEINDHFGIALSHLIFGMTYGDIGEFELSLKESKKSLTLFKKINNKKWIATLLNNIGYISAIMGDYDLALEYLEQSLILLEEFNPMGVDYILDSLIFACLEKGDFNQAQQYFQRLEYIYEQKKERSLVTTYLYNKALMLKISPRIRDIAEAEKLFKQVIEEEIFSFDITIKAFIHLCDLLLKELRLTNDIGVVEELDLYITQLLTIAEKSHSYYILCETYMLQAKLALLTLDLDESQRLLIQAQQIAERYGIKRLAIKISNEHDQLLKQLKKWESVRDSNTSLTERLKLAGLDEQIKDLIKKRMIDLPELSSEEPVLLLIVSEGGTPIFSQLFSEDQAFEDHIFGGFFTAINSFINEKFSEGLDRASFGEYTLFMNSASPFLVCYLFKGQSYSAQHRIGIFINKIQSDTDVWKSLNQFHRTNKEVQLKDVPILESIIKEIFVDAIIS